MSIARHESPKSTQATRRWSRSAQAGDRSRSRWLELPRSRLPGSCAVGLDRRPRGSSAVSSTRTPALLMPVLEAAQRAARTRPQRLQGIAEGAIERLAVDVVDHQPPRTTAAARRTTTRPSDDTRASQAHAVGSPKSVARPAAVGRTARTRPGRPRRSASSAKSTGPEHDPRAAASLPDGEQVEIDRQRADHQRELHRGTHRVASSAEVRSSADRPSARRSADCALGQLGRRSARSPPETEAGQLLGRGPSGNPCSGQARRRGSRSQQS